MSELNLSLFQIEDGLRDLYAMREEARERYADSFGRPEHEDASKELDVIEKAICDYIGAELRKVDGTADFMLMLDRLCHEPRERKGATERCEIDREIDRLKARREQLRGVLEHIQESVKFVMQGMQWRDGKPKKLEGVRHSITLRGNGGAQPVEITDESLVQDDFKRITLTLNLEFASKLMVSLAMEGWQDEADFEVLREAFDKGKCEVSKSAIAAALEKPCPRCDGKTFVTVQDTWSKGHTEDVQCSACGGSGKQGIPGARLAPRGESLVVK